jgi:hypothetical protein
LHPFAQTLSLAVAHAKHSACTQNGAAAGQTFPHAPQFCGSLVSSVHTPPHADWFAQGEHLPWKQKGALAGQTLPHAPQFCASVCESTHWLLQAGPSAHGAH